MTPRGQVAGSSPAGVTATGLARSDGSLTTWTSRSLLPRYEEYRRHQARELLSLLPPEGVRALYRAARAEFSEGGAVTDPMALLDEFVTQHLPLPPFHIWVHDVRQNPHAHLDQPWMRDALPERSAPMTVALREESVQGRSCKAELRVYHSDAGWRGHLRFTRAGEERSWQTGDVFREESAETIVERFHEFSWPTLEAFLRSILP
jgi:hypothetical protein